MKNTFKLMLAVSAIAILSSPAFAEDVIRTETTREYRTVTLKDDYSQKNTTNRATGKHYSGFSLDYRQPEPAATAGVIDVQQKLAAEGFYEGKIDGILGNETREALREYQAANGLRQTGALTAPSLDRMGLVYDENSTVIEREDYMVPTGRVSSTTTVRTVRE